MVQVSCVVMSSVKFLILILTALFASVLTQPYANDYSYDKYGFKREGALSNSDESRYLKNNFRDQDGRLKSHVDSAVSYNLDANKNHHDVNQKKQGTSTDQLTHVQGENFENDKSHKRKHVKSGFTNSYHKDENGSRSSYYEDSDDNGGRTTFDKRHGTRGDNQESQFSEGQRNGISRDRYDDRKSGYDSRDLVDQQRYRAEDLGKQHGYVDNYKDGLSDRYEIVRRPYSDLNRLNYHSRFRDVDSDYDRYNPSQHWGYNNRLPSVQNMHHHDSSPGASRDFQTRRKITIYEDPRDEVDPKIDRFHDNGNYMTRSEITRRFDYGPADRTPMRMRFRGL